MAFFDDMEAFKAELSQHSIARPNQFLVVFAPPISITGGQASSQRLSLRAEATEFPGISAATKEINHNGTTYELPYSPLFNEWTITFKASSSHLERQFFTKWLNTVVQFQEGGGFASDEVGFQDNYKADIKIMQLGSPGKAYCIEILDAWPKTLVPIPLEINTTDDYERMDVTFVFRRWRECGLPESGIQPGLPSPGESNPSTGSGGRILQGGNGVTAEENANFQNNKQFEPGGLYNQGVPSGTPSGSFNDALRFAQQQAKNFRQSLPENQ